MPKDSVLTKYSKRTSVVLILSLAIVGLFSVLRKAPQLHIPEEDRGYIEEIFGGSEFKTSGNPSDSGVSGLMDFGVSGMPPVGGSSVGKSAPPKSMGSSPAGSSEAPSFLAIPTSSVPTYSVQTDAPVFASQQPQTSQSNSLPVLMKAPAALEAAPAPVYGSQYQTAPVNVPAPPAQEAPPFVPSPPPATPNNTNTILPDTTFIPASPLTLYVQPPSFDGPAEAIPEETFIPAISAVSAASVMQSFPFSEPQGNVAALGTEVQSFSSADASPLVEPAAPVAAVQNTVQNTVVQNAVQNPAPQVVFIAPPFKQLPQVEEGGYYQTSIKNADTPVAAPVAVSAGRTAAMVLTPPQRSSSPEEAAKVSFSPQMEKPVKIVSPEVVVPEKTLIVSEPVIVETETIPFVASRAETALANAVPANTIPETPLVQQVSANNVSDTHRVNAAKNYESRSSVLQFIDAQCKEADSDSPERLRNAFIQLSRLYDRKELTEAERNHLVPVLSRIGVDVIFSRRQNILEPAYIVKEGDTPDTVAAAFQISPELLMKINGLTGARPLKAGTPLKVIHGQFDARISLDKEQFILVLGGLYAGQFPVSVGKEIQRTRGEFYVVEKRDSYRGKTLTLNNGVVLRSGPQDGKTLCFADKDANELFDILTENSVIMLE